VIEFSMADPAAWARHILDSGSYMVLGTADESGTPWASPVWYAHRDYRDFFWVSRPDVRHSQNISVRREIGIVVFDTSVKPGRGQGVYLRATAQELHGADLESGLEVYVRRSAMATGWAPTMADVSGSGPYRLYRASASEYSMLAKDGQPDHRIEVDLFG
jgi:hypothetical protein